MVVGFNHNIMYKGEMFHIQTEDNGVKSPTIVTLLYQGGTIISSKKTSYADIVKIDNLDQVVEELMKDQHKEMLRMLKSGAFDARAFRSAPPAVVQKPLAPAPAPASPVKTAPPVAPAPSAKEKPREESLDDIIFNFLTSGDE